MILFFKKGKGVILLRERGKLFKLILKELGKQVLVLYTSLCEERCLLKNKKTERFLFGACVIKLLVLLFCVRYWYSWWRTSEALEDWSLDS